MKLYFVRHGRTKWNKEGRFQGAAGDSPLSKTGKLDVIDLADHIQDIKFDHVYSSDLKRAEKTVNIILETLGNDIPVTYAKELREWDLGSLEGQKISIMQSIYPKQIDAFEHNLGRFNNGMFNAESVHDTTSRVINYLHDELKDKDYENVLIIGHGANLTATIRTLLGYVPGELRRLGGLDNASVTILETKDLEHFNVLEWNNTSFIDNYESHEHPHE